MSSVTEKALHKLGAALPDAERGISCEGTAIEATTYGVKKRAFLFLRSVGDGLELRLKLEVSVAEAEKLSRANPKRFSVGAGGWTKLSFNEADAPPLPLLRKWIGESHALVRPPAKKPATKTKKKR